MTRQGIRFDSENVVCAVTLRNESMPFGTARCHVPHRIFEPTRGRIRQTALSGAMIGHSVALWQATNQTHENFSAS